MVLFNGPSGASPQSCETWTSCLMVVSFGRSPSVLIGQRQTPEHFMVSRRTTGVAVLRSAVAARPPNATTISAATKRFTAKRIDPQRVACNYSATRTGVCDLVARPKARTLKWASGREVTRGTGCTWRFSFRLVSTASDTSMTIGGRLLLCDEVSKAVPFDLVRNQIVISMAIGGRGP